MIYGRLLRNANSLPSVVEIKIGNEGSKAIQAEMEDPGTIRLLLTFITGVYGDHRLYSIMSGRQKKTMKWIQ